METAWIADGSRILQAVGWTLIHSLWQAAVVYVLLSLLLRALPGLPARVKYACGVLALGAVVAWSGITLIRHWPAATAIPTAVGYSMARAAAQRSFLWFLDEAIPWLMMAYGLGLGLMLGRLLLGFTEVRRLRRSGIGAGGEIEARLRRLESRLGLKRPVGLRISPLVAVPMVVGLLRPVILLPPSCLDSLSPAALEAVLLHELAHIRRADYLVNILQSIVEAVLFFNPCVRRISGLLRREREHCCDDLVVSTSGRPLEYAEALVSLASAGREPVLAMAARSASYPLLNRIKRITTMENKSLRPGTVIIVSGIAALIVAVSIACFTPAFAQRKSKSDRSAAQTAPPPPPAAVGIPVPAPAPVAPPAAPAAPAAPAPPAPPSAAAAGLAALDAVFATMPQVGDSLAAVLSDAMSEVDWDDVRRDLQQASADIRNINWDRIRQETRAAAAQAERQIDWKEIERCTRQAMAEADRALASAPAAVREARRQADDGRAETLREARERATEARERAAEARERKAEAEELRREAIERRQEARERAAEERESLEEARRELDEARRELDQARKELEKERSRRN